MLTLQGNAGFPPFLRMRFSAFSQTSIMGMFSFTCVFISSLVSRRIFPDCRNFSSSSLSKGILRSVGLNVSWCLNVLTLFWGLFGLCFWFFLN